MKNILFQNRLCFADLLGHFPYKAMFFFLFCIGVNSRSNAQLPSLEWVKQFSIISDSARLGGAETEALKLDGAGDIITAGYFSAIIDFNPDTAIADTVFLQSPPHNNAFFVSKLNSQGGYVWAKRIWSNKYFSNRLTQSSLALDNGGNVFLAGSFMDSCHFDNLIIRSHPTQWGDYGTNDGFISKLDAQGNFLWVRQIGGANHDYITSIASDPVSGGVIIAGFLAADTFQVNTINGTVTISSPNDAIFICKLDSSGNFLWAKQLGDDSSWVSDPALHIDENNNIYITGNFVGSLDINPGLGADTLNGAGIFICKLTSQADLVWSGVINNDFATLSNSPSPITVDKEGNVFTTGQYYRKTDFDPGSDTAFLNTNHSLDINIFVCKWNSGGGFEWVKGFLKTIEDTIPPAFGVANSVQSISVDNAGDVFTSGFFSGFVDFDPGLSINDTFILRSTQSLNGYVAKLSPQGDLRWAFQLKTPNNTISSSSASTVTIGESGAIFCGGGAPNSVNFNPNGIYFLPKDGAYILKLKDTDTDTNSNNGIALLQKNMALLRLFPNPAHSEIYLQNENSVPMESLVVYNVLGQLMAQQKGLPPYRCRLDVHNWASGTYFVKVGMVNGKVAQGKFEIRR